jgi:hypothetical protein
MNKNYSVYEANLNTLIAKLTRLNAKLARINIAPITWKQVGHHDEPHPSIENAVVRYIDLEVEGIVPSENGWSFVATVVHTDDGNIIRSVPGYTVPVEYRDRPTWCDHCKTNRVRRDTYIVRHEDGRVMQVGSSCLADFIGTSNPNGLTKASEILLNVFDVCDAAQKKEWLGGSNALSTYRIDLDTYLQNVAAVVLKEGRYVTRKMARESEEAAGSGVGRILTASSDAAMSAMRNRQHSPGVYAEITPEAEKLATDAREWVLRKYSPAIIDVDGMSEAAIMGSIMTSMKAANTSLSDFEHNLLSCARAEAIEPRLAGIAAYIIEAFRRSQPRAEAAQLNNAGLSRIFAMFDTAKAQLKHPAIRLANEAGQHLHLSLAGAASKNAGYVYVKANSGFDAAYYGKISPEGKFFKVGSCPATIEPLLQSFANDPEGIATKYGRLTGCCCFCGRKLTDERSTIVGYGPVCADKFGLDWGKKAAAAVAPVQAAATVAA